MPIEEYLTSRLSGQIKYYDDKAGRMQRLHHRLSLSGILISAFIPVFVLFPDTCSFSRYLAAALGSTVSVLSGALYLFKPKDIWIQCRKTCEELIAQRALYQTASGPYASLSPEAQGRLLVETCEQIMDAERQDWKQHVEVPIHIGAESGVSGGTSS